MPREGAPGAELGITQVERPLREALVGVDLLDLQDVEVFTAHLLGAAQGHATRGEL
jgi:hypothetical protein